MTPLLTAADVAALLHKPEPWVTAAARAGIIPGRKIGRTWGFTEGDVQAFIDAASSVRPAEGDVTKRRRRPQSVSA